MARERRNQHRRNGGSLTLLAMAVVMAGTVLFGPAIASNSGSVGLSAKLPSGVDKKTGYRMGRYRGPTPDRLPGGAVVDLAWMKRAAAGSTVLMIDVFPPKGLGPDPLDGSWRSSEKRESIAGSIWLPEVGRGHLEQDAIDYLTRNLKRATRNNKNKPMVFFCTADCWQGWNAAYRAVRMGYQQVHWYAEGTDGWLEANGLLVAVEPVNFFD